MRRMTLLTSLAVLLLASACGRPVSTPPPPAADVEAVTEPKPKPSIEAAIEAWGERVRSAGVNLCLLLKDRFPDMDYDCGD